MTTPKIEKVTSIPISIFMAGDIKVAKQCVKTYCDDTGFCVTVTPTTYVYTNGHEDGVIIGLINYPRFPSDETTLLARAVELANMLLKEMQQESFSIQTPTETYWHSYRFDDVTTTTEYDNTYDDS